MTRDQLKAWAKDVGKFDHLTYVGKDTTLADVKLSLALEFERESPPVLDKKMIVGAIESAIAKSAVSYDLSDWMTEENLIEFGYHVAVNATQVIILESARKDRTS